MSKKFAAEPRIALVTGANRNIGLETVRRLVQARCRVYSASRNEELARVAAAQAGAEPIVLNVEDDIPVASAAELVRSTDGRLDLLVTNAGISGTLRDIHDYTGADLSGLRGHRVHDGTDAILDFALSEPRSPSGVFHDRAGELPR